MKDLIDLSLSEYSKVLASDAPAPGGGSAAALAGAQAAALIGMVASLTLGRKKYAEYEPLAREAQEEAEALRLSFLKAIDADCAAYQGVSAAYALPKETPEEKAARSAAIQAALLPSTQSPLTVMALSRETVLLIRRLSGRSNRSAATDLGVAALMARAAAHSAWLNVLINLGSLKDEAAVKAYRGQGESLLAEVTELSSALVLEVEGSL